MTVHWLFLVITNSWPRSSTIDNLWNAGFQKALFIINMYWERPEGKKQNVCADFIDIQFQKNIKHHKKNFVVLPVL